MKRYQTLLIKSIKLNKLLITFGKLFMFCYKEFSVFGLLFFLIFSNNSIGQSHVVFNQTCSNAYLFASRMQTEQAKTMLAEAQKTDSQNQAYLFVSNYADLVKLLVNTNKSEFENFKTQCSEKISVFENIATESPIKDAIIAELYFHRSMARIVFNEKIRAAFDLRKAKLLSNLNRKKYPNFDYNLKLSGLLNLITGSIPDDLKWAASLASLSGSIEKGIQEINRYHRSVQNDTLFNCFYPEATCLKIAVIQTFDPIAKAENRVKAILFDPEIEKEISVNKLLTFVCADFMMKNGMNDHAIEILLSMNFDESFLNFSYIDYLTGIALQNKMDNRAVTYFFKYVLNTSNENYVKATYQRIAWHYLLNNSSFKYQEYIQNVLKFGLQNSESDNAAIEEANSGIKPNLILLKARLLFDGGYYDKSLEALKQYKTEPIVSEKNIEYLYRLARIYDEKGDETTALKYYNTVIAQASNKAWFYAANSCLMAGFMHEIKKENKIALKYYNACLKLNPNKYKTSIHQKAKAGKNRIEKGSAA